MSPDRHEIEVARIRRWLTLVGPVTLVTPGATPAPAPRRADSAAVRAVIATDRAIYRVARHWLLVLNLLALPFALLPLVAPLLRAGGEQALARPIYAFFSLLCHQREDRSFHLYGEKMACCHRCFAIYGGLFALGVLYIYLRPTLPRFSRRNLVWASLLSLPVLLDVALQIVTTWESTWYVRTITGALFALAISVLALPYLERGFRQIRRDLERRFARLVVQGRTRPLPGQPSL